MILICRFAVDPDQAHDFLTRARRALGRSPDEVTRWVLADAQGGAVADHGSLLARDAERWFGFGDR